MFLAPSFVGMTAIARWATALPTTSVDTNTNLALHWKIIHRILLD